VLKGQDAEILTAHDGGSDHCQEDNRQVGRQLVADDWLAERLPRAAKTDPTGNFA